MSPRWEAATPSAEDGACVGGGARIDGELLDEATLDLRERELTRLSAHLDAATHRQLTLIRLMDASERWSQQGAKSCAAWLSWKIGLAPGPAREHVRVARALAALPHIDDALRRGAISYSKVRAMTRVATPANERKLLDAALETTAAQLEKICRGLRQVQRHDDRPPADDAPERLVRLRYRGDGTVRVEAVLLPDEAQRVMDALRLVRAAMRQEQAPERAETQPELASAQPDLPDALARIADDILAGDLRAGDLRAGDVIAGDIEADRLPADAGRSRGDADRPSRDAHERDHAGPHSRGDADRLSRDAHARDHAGPHSRGSAERPSASTASDAERSRGDADPRLGHFNSTGPDPRSRGDADRLSACTASDAERSRGDADPRLGHFNGTGPDPRSPGDADRLSRDAHAPDHAGPRSRGDAERPHPRIPRTSGAERTQIIVHLTDDRIDGDHAAFLDDGSRISPETFRRLACDCGLIGVREDRDGAPLDIGRKTRAIPPALRRAVMLRDEHCQFPGCTHDRHIDLHHIEHWAHGGPTSKQNLIALCTFHHTLVHEGGFTLDRGVDGLRFLVPDRAAPLPRFHIPPPAPSDPLAAFERAHTDLRIHDETGLTGWDGERIHYDDIVEALTAADAPHAAVEPGQADAPMPGDLDLPVRAWLAKHGLDRHGRGKRAIDG